MKSGHRLKKEDALNMMSAIFGMLGFSLIIYLGATLYSRGVYVDEHNLSGYITSTEVILGISALLLELGCIICFAIAHSNR